VNHPEHAWEQQREQLSALLDNGLSAQERAALEAHLEDCSQCRVELESLRRTRALLRALPQPALPRSFTLPLKPAAPERQVPGAQQAPVPSAARRLTGLPVSRTYALRRPVQVLQWLSAIAAVLGIVILLSGVFSTLHVGGGAANSALSGTLNQGDKNGSATGPQSPTHSPNVNTPSTAGADEGTPAPTPPAPTLTPPSPTPGAGFGQHTSGGSASSLSGYIFSTTSVGLFLLLLSVCGFAISWALRRRW